MEKLEDNENKIEWSVEHLICVNDSASNPKHIFRAFPST